MRASLAKRLLSRLIPLVVEKRAGETTSELEVALQNGRYVLNSREVNYSFGALHRVFRKAFERQHLQERSINDALVLGFGTGSVAHILLEEYKMNCRITGVDSDAEVIALGKKYFEPIFSHPSVTIVQADAAVFVQEDTANYDLIVVDVFVDANVPESCRSNEFLVQLKKLLRPKGTLFFNFILTTENGKAFDALSKTFQDAFGKMEMMRLSIDGAMNRVLVYQR